jgi:hypothetical protein
MELEKVIAKMFAEGQAKLPVVDRCAQKASEFCLAENDGFKCTKSKGHDGDHCAHERLGGIAHRWK